MALWSIDEANFLMECAHAKIPAGRIALLLERPVTSVRMKRHRMGLHPPNGPCLHMVTEHGAASVSTIQRMVAAHFGIAVEEMTSTRRDREVARPRQVAMFFAREVALKSYPRIGQMFGGRDHSTAIHARQQIQRLCAEKASFAQEVEELRENIVHPQLKDHSTDFAAFVSNQAGA